MTRFRKHFAIAALALAAAAGAGAKTLVFCSEGSPENFYPGVNTTGTSSIFPIRTPDRPADE